MFLYKLKIRRTIQYLLLITLTFTLFGCNTAPTPDPASATKAIAPSASKTVDIQPHKTLDFSLNTTKKTQNTLSASEISNYQEAVQALNNQNTRKALLIFEELQSTQPWFIGAWINAGKALVEQGHWAEALKTLQQAETLQPELAATYNLQAYCHRQLGDFHKAQAAYEKLLHIQPDYALAHYNYGILLDLYLQKPKQALVHYEHYQRLQKKPDKQVHNWIKELKRRVKGTPAKP